MSYETNAYYHPEQLGLTQIGHLEDPDACWSYDSLVVWRHVDGRLYWARDAGCSCPTPFEDYDTLGSLNQITNATWADFEAAVVGHCWGEWASARRAGDPDPLAADKTELLAKVAKALRSAS